jgi:hypothetical protein
MNKCFRVNNKIISGEIRGNVHIINDGRIKELYVHAYIGSIKT